MWTCNNCNEICNDEAKEFCFNCMTPRKMEYSTNQPEEFVQNQQEKTAVESNSESPIPKSEEPKDDVPHTFTTPEKPVYLVFLRFLGGLNIFIGLFGFIICFANIGKLFDTYDRDRESGSFWFVIGLAMLLEGSLAFGLLNAIADIAENMIEVGKYVRKLKDTPEDKK